MWRDTIKLMLGACLAGAAVYAQVPAFFGLITLWMLYSDLINENKELQRKIDKLTERRY